MIEFITIVFLFLFFGGPEYIARASRGYLSHRRKMRAIDQISTMRALGESDPTVEEQLEKLAK